MLDIPLQPVWEIHADLPCFLKEGSFVHPSFPNAIAGQRGCLWTFSLGLLSCTRCGKEMESLVHEAKRIGFFAIEMNAGQNMLTDSG